MGGGTSLLLYYHRVLVWLFYLSESSTRVFVPAGKTNHPEANIDDLDVSFLYR